MHDLPQAMPRNVQTRHFHASQYISSEKQTTKARVQVETAAVRYLVLNPKSHRGAFKSQRKR